MVKQEIRRYYAVPEAKLHVIYNPVDAELFHPSLREGRAALLARHGIDAGATVFLLAVPDAPRIDVGAAIDAFARQGAPARLIVLLGAERPGRHLARARAAGAADRVTFVGSDADRRAYLGAADVFVWPARYDPSPDVPFEAMACGVPVVASDKSGAAELLRDCDAGLVYTAGDVAAIAAHMQALLDPGVRARLGPNARRAVSSFSPAAITLQQVLLYRDLLASPASGIAMAVNTAHPIHDFPVNTR